MVINWTQPTDPRTDNLKAWATVRYFDYDVRVAHYGPSGLYDTDFIVADIHDGDIELAAAASPIYNPASAGHLAVSLVESVAAEAAYDACLAL